MLHAQVSNKPSAHVLPLWHSGLEQARVTLNPASSASRAGMALDELAGRGAYQAGGDLYYDAQASDFAQPAVQAVLDTLGMRWMEDRLAQSRHEQAAHQRLRKYAAGDGFKQDRWSRVAALVSAAVAGGLVGAFSFGSFAMVVGQVAAAMNHTPAGFGKTSAGEFSGTAAGKAVVANLVGALPGSLAYGVCSGLSATAVRPLVDAVALLLGGGHVTPFVPVDPVLAFPTQSPVTSGGWPKDGTTYTAELQATARKRAAMARRQAAMLDVGDTFNLKYGMPLFAVCHAIRLMVLTSLQSGGTGLGAGAGALVSAGASGLASAGLAIGSGTERAWRAVDADGDQGLPLFLPAHVHRRLRGETEPALAAAVKGGFTAAGAAYTRNLGLLRKLLLGVPAAALGVWGATVPINVLVPLATWSGSALRDKAPAAILAAGGITLAAFCVAYGLLGRALSKVGRIGQPDLQAQQQARLAEAFTQSVHSFARRWPTHPSRSGEWSIANLAVLYDDMNRRVMADLDLAVAQGRNHGLDPGADMRLRDAYAATAVEMRQLLVAAHGAESTAPERRTAAQNQLLESLRPEMERLKDRSNEVDAPGAAADDEAAF